MRRPSRQPRVAAVALVLGLGWGAGWAGACTTNAECNDADPCNGSETCEGGTCVPGTPVTCDDTNPCTIDVCYPATGCTFTPTDGCVIAGKKLRVGTSGEPRIGLQTSAQLAGLAFPTNFSDDDPVVHGASLRVLTTAGDLFDNLYPLPHESWTYFKGAGQNLGYHYADLHGVYGPVTLAVVRNGKPAKIKARGYALGVSLGGDPAPVDVVLRFGNLGRRYCLRFGGRTKFSPGVRFTAVAAPPPEACP